MHTEGCYWHNYVECRQRCCRCGVYGIPKEKVVFGDGMEVGEVIDGWFRGNYGGL